MKKFNTRGLTTAAIIACLYAVLTLMPGLNALGYGPVQFRVAEALCVLPVFTPWAIPGLVIGCLIANLASPMFVIDMIFGTAATFLAAWSTYKLRKYILAALLMPAVFNGIIVGAELTFFYTKGAPTAYLFMTNMLTVAAGELVVCYVLGYPLAKWLQDKNMFV